MLAKSLAAVIFIFIFIFSIPRGNPFFDLFLLLGSNGMSCGHENEHRSNDEKSSPLDVTCTTTDACGRKRKRFSNEYRKLFPRPVTSDSEPVVPEPVLSTSTWCQIRRHSNDTTASAHPLAYGNSLGQNDNADPMFRSCESVKRRRMNTFPTSISDEEFAFLDNQMPLSTSGYTVNASLPPLLASNSSELFVSPGGMSNGLMCEEFAGAYGYAQASVYTRAEDDATETSCVPQSSHFQGCEEPRSANPRPTLSRHSTQRASEEAINRRYTESKHPKDKPGNMIVYFLRGKHHATWESCRRGLQLWWAEEGGPQELPTHACVYGRFHRTANSIARSLGDVGFDWRDYVYMKKSRSQRLIDDRMVEYEKTDDELKGLVVLFRVTYGFTRSS